MLGIACQLPPFLPPFSDGNYVGSVSPQEKQPVN